MSAGSLLKPANNSIKHLLSSPQNCLFFPAGEVQCDCRVDNAQIGGGHYTLTKGVQSGSMLVYHCPEGYYPHPVLSRVCQANGTWRPAPKRFQPEKCRSEWREDDVSQFDWDCLHYIITQLLLFCFAVIECPDPNVLEYGDVSPPQEKYLVHNETTYECYSGYTMRGSSKRVCLPNGKWSGSTPICSRDSKSWTAAFFLSLPPFSFRFKTHPHSWPFYDFVFFATTAGSACADPGIPAGASRTGNIFETDDTVKYTCNGNLFLVGSSERKCLENGQWTGIEPVCFCKTDI